MARKTERRFTAEVRKLRERHKDATVADVMVALDDLEDNIEQKIIDQISRMNDKLSGVADEDAEKAKVSEIMEEIQAMSDHITLTKKEIAALKPVDEASTSVVGAAEELGHVVKATEEATDTILANAEKIENELTLMRAAIPAGDPDGMGPHIDSLDDIGIEIITACGFQDLTGQRINKVVNTLNNIEERLQNMIEIWRIEDGTADRHDMAFAKDDARGDKDLIHGPQNENSGMNQSDIDALFD